MGVPGCRYKDPKRGEKRTMTVADTTSKLVSLRRPPGQATSGIGSVALAQT
jgi:hypothetical protein